LFLLTAVRVVKLFDAWRSGGNTNAPENSIRDNAPLGGEQAALRGA
jgi:hypothetical protein